MKKRGITLIEMVVVIVLIGLVVPGLLALFRTVTWRAMRAEAMTQASFYAEELMEEIRSKKFSDPDTETAGDYDDVSDYNGYSDSPAAGYTRNASVVYLDGGISAGGTWTTSGSPTNYKRITVTVTRADNLVTDLSLITLVSSQ